MSIETELTDILRDRVREGDTKDRNIEMIAYHYGFRGHSWPTLEQTGVKFGAGTRERVRQILERDFKGTVNPSEVPSLRKCYELVETKEYWLYSELSQRISESGLAGDSFYIEGIFNLLDVLGFPNQYGIFTPELKKQPRNDGVGATERVVMDRSLVKKIAPLLRKVRRLPGKYGIARLDYLDDESGTLEAYEALVMDMIKYSRESWTYQDEGALWYLFEDVADNALVNFSKKVFSLVDRCDAERLADTYHNALRRRSQQHDYPSVGILDSYLRTSKHFDRIGDQVMYKGQTDRTKSPIENDLVEYLRQNSASKYPEMREHLSRLNYSHPNITKAVMYSPLVHVDRTGGRSNHLYSLVETVEAPIEEDWYTQVRRRLIDLGNTDEVYELKTRREQQILRDWLFDKKDRESCAICGVDYPVAALVAAHKKRRTECTEVERTDPHIVMPLCRFGCDFLYEEKHVRVNEGLVTEGNRFKGDEEGRRYLDKLVGRRVEDEWLRGSSSYFL